MASTPITVTLTLGSGVHTIRIEHLSGGVATLTAPVVAAEGPGVYAETAAEAARAGEAVAGGVTSASQVADAGRAGEAVSGAATGTASGADSARAGDAASAVKAPVQEVRTDAAVALDVAEDAVSGQTTFTARTPLLAAGVHTVTLRHLSGGAVVVRPVAVTLATSAVTEDVAEVARASDATASQRTATDAPADSVRTGDAGVLLPGVHVETPADAVRAADEALGDVEGQLADTVEGGAQAGDEAGGQVISLEDVREAARAGESTTEHVPGSITEVVEDGARAGDSAESAIGVSAVGSNTRCSVRRVRASSSVRRVRAVASVHRR